MAALPGNARYARPTHGQHGRLTHSPSRIVSAPAVLSHPSRQPSITPQPVVGDAASVAQILARHHAQYVQQQQQQYANYPLDEWNSITVYNTRNSSLAGSVGHPTRRPASVVQPAPSTWSANGFGFPGPLFGDPPTVSALLPPHPLFHPPASAPEPALVLQKSTSQPWLADPAIVAAFGPKDLDAGDSSFYDGSSSEETPQQFYFPAIPPVTQFIRRVASTALPTTVPRRPSIPDAPLQPVANADRRNSAAPTTTATRRMSLAPSVTVSNRRQSVAAQTRLARDSTTTQAGSNAMRQPKPPPVTHAKAASESTLKQKASAAGNLVTQSPSGADEDLSKTEFRAAGGWRGRGGRGRGSKSTAAARGRGAPRTATAVTQGGE